MTKWREAGGSQEIPEIWNTFSLDPGLVYRVEEEMRRRKHRNRSETIRVLLGEALAK